jgi:hypothetical protein
LGYVIAIKVVAEIQRKAESSAVRAEKNFTEFNRMAAAFFCGSGYGTAQETSLAGQKNLGAQFIEGHWENFPAIKLATTFCLYS